MENFERKLAIFKLLTWILLLSSPIICIWFGFLPLIKYLGSILILIFIEYIFTKSIEKIKNK